MRTRHQAMPLASAPARMAGPAHEVAGRRRRRAARRWRARRPSRSPPPPLGTPRPRNFWTRTWRLQRRKTPCGIRTPMRGRRVRPRSRPPRPGRRPRTPRRRLRATPDPVQGRGRSARGRRCGCSTCGSRLGSPRGPRRRSWRPRMLRSARATSRRAPAAFCSQRHAAGEPGLRDVTEAARACPLQLHSRQ